MSPLEVAAELFDPHFWWVWGMGGIWTYLGLRESYKARKPR